MPGLRPPRPRRPRQAWLYSWLQAALAVPSVLKCLGNSLPTESWGGVQRMPTLSQEVS